MTHPIAIAPIVQKDAGDCALAALSMLTNVPYPEVRRVAKTLYPDSAARGLRSTHILRVAKKLGHPLTRRWLKGILSEDLEGDTGMLHIVKRVGRRWHGHAVVLFEGVVIDPHDGVSWNLDAYLAESGWTLYALLELA
jgi:hypothetical protein